MFFFAEKFSDEKGSVGRCFVVMQYAVLLSKFGAKPTHIFMQSPLNITAVCGIGCLACQSEYFVNNPLGAKENNEHALDFALRLSRRFRSR
jgi:hypothetical protein